MEKLNAAYRAYGRKINWTLSTLQTEPQHDGSFHIEVTAHGYAWVVTERGAELERLAFDVQNDLLEHIFHHLTFWAGVEYELKHREAGVDGRRKIFAHQLELLQKLDERWWKTAVAKINQTLQNHPYTDQ